MNVLHYPKAARSPIASPKQVPCVHLVHNYNRNYAYYINYNVEKRWGIHVHVM